MTYDAEKDKVLKKWKCAETGLVVSINQYGDGEPKVQIGPRILLKKDGSERRQGRATFLWRSEQKKNEVKKVALWETEFA